MIMGVFLRCCKRAFRGPSPDLTERQSDPGAERRLEGESLDLEVATNAHRERLRFVHQVRSEHG